MKTLSIYKRSSLTLIILTFILFLSYFVANQIDEAILPEIAKIETDLNLTAAESEGIQISTTLKKICQKEVLTNEVFAELETLIGKQSFRTSTPSKGASSCLVKMANPFYLDGYLKYLNQQFGQNPEQAIPNLQGYFNFMIQTALRSDGIVNRTLALSGLVAGLQLAKIWKSKVPSVGSKVNYEDLDSLIKLSDSDYLIKLREAEMMAYKGSLSEDFLSKFRSERHPLSAKLLKYFYLPNKTKNLFWLALSDCLVNTCDANRRKSIGKISFRNPVGSALVASLIPDYESHKNRIRALRSQITAARSEIR